MTRTTLFITLCLLFASGFCFQAKGQDAAMGVYNSLKGFGICTEVDGSDQDHERFNTYILSMDIYGMPMGRTERPGIKFNFSHNHVLVKGGRGGVDSQIYAGPGAAVGLVQDRENSVASQSRLVNNPGVVAALSGSAGMRMLFREHVLIDLSFTFEAGFHIRNDEWQDQRDLRFYSNGISRAWYPQLSILYKF